MREVKSEIKNAILIFMLTMFLLVSLPVPAYANDAVGFYSVGGSWSNGEKYYKHITSQIQFEVADNAGHGLSLIDGGIRIYNKNNELVAVQCNEEDARLARGFCQTFYDIAPDGKLVWTWDQKYHTGNPKKDDANNDGVHDFVPKGTYYGFINTAAYKNYGTAIIEYKTAQFVLDDDSDADGIPNGADVCPQTNGGGTGNAKGCPDGDNDGIPDEKDDGSQPDKCQNTKEYYNNYKDGDGCPDGGFAGGPPIGVCTSEECKQAQIKNAARHSAQFAVVREAAATITGISISTPKEPKNPTLGEINRFREETKKFRYAVIASLGFEVVSDYFTVTEAKKIIEDPPDPNYKAAVEFKQTQIKLLNGTDRETQLINNLFMAGRAYADAVDAFVSANEKYMGANEAGDEYWINIHSAERKKYALLVAQHLERFNDADKAAEDLISEQFGNKIITKNDLINFQNELEVRRSAALPQEEIEMLKNNLGGNDADVENLVYNIISIDPDAWIDTSVLEKGKLAREANQELINAYKNIAIDSDRNIFITFVFLIIIIIIIMWCMSHERGK